MGKTNATFGKFIITRGHFCLLLQIFISASPSPALFPAPDKARGADILNFSCG